MVADSNDIETLLEDDIKLVAQKLVNMVAAKHDTAPDDRDETDVEMCDGKTAAVPTASSSSSAAPITTSNSPINPSIHTATSTTTVIDANNNNNNHHHHANGVIEDSHSNAGDTNNHSNGDSKGEDGSAMDVSEEPDGPWKNLQIDPNGETTLPNGLTAVCGVVDLPYYREPDSDRPFRFTNQLNFLKTILTKYICRYKTAMPFMHPVDSVHLKIPHYYLVIRQPMDLSTVKNRINFLWYNSAEECISDIRLIFSNCYQFNSPTDYVYKAGKKLEEYLDDKLKDMPPVETEIPCPPRPNINEYQKMPKRSPVIARTGSISEHSENGDLWPYGPIKMTTRSERGVMVRKPSKDLPEPISTPQPKGPTVKKVPLNEPMKYCLDFVKDLFGKKHQEYAWPFYYPVDPVEYPDYGQKIKRPMDLSTIKTKIESGKYITLNDYANDMRLMFSNCLRYNTTESPIIEQVRKLREAFEYSYSRVPDEWHGQRLEIPRQHNHTSNHNHSRTPPVTPVSLRITPSSGGSSSSSSKHHHSADSHKRHKSNSSSSNSKNHHGEGDKKCFKVRNSAESMIDLSLFPTPPSPSVRFAGNVGGNHRIEQLEKHVASLTTALQHALSAGVGNGNGALMNAILPLTPNSAPPVLNGGGGSAPSRGRPRKNGMPAQPRSSLNNNYNNNNNSTRKVNNKKPSQKRKVRHLSSSSEDEYDQADSGNSSQPAFNPEDIEDLKKLKNDLENLRANDLQNVLRILQRTEPSLRCDDESNVEIDFEALQSSTLVALRKYVTSCMLNNASGSSSALV